MNRTALRSVMLFLALAGCSLAIAKPSFWDRMNALYKVDPQSELGKLQCKACHSADGPPDRNVYGKRVGSLINHANDGTPIGGVTDNVMIFVEGEDSDKDGYTNLEELVAGTLPGDPNSHPQSHPTNLPKHEMSRSFDPMLVRVTGGLLALGVIFAVAGKAAKKAYLGKAALGAGVLGVLSLAWMLFQWFVSNKHP